MTFRLLHEPTGSRAHQSRDGLWATRPRDWVGSERKRLASPDVRAALTRGGRTRSLFSICGGRSTQVSKVIGCAAAQLVQALPAHQCLPAGSGDTLVVVLEVPGCQQRGSRYSSQGQHHPHRARKEIAYPGSVSVHRRERLTGTFDRTLTVPMQIDADGIKAEYRDGVLALSLPRAESDKPRTIRIN